MNIQLQDNMVTCQFEDYDPALVSMVNKKGLGMRFDARKKEWRHPATYTFIKAFADTFPDEAPEEFTQMLTGEADVSEWVPSAFLMGHQMAGATLALTHHRHGFFYETGTGKTLLGLEIIKQKGIKTLVVCPLSIIENAWMEDAEKFYPEFNIQNLWNLARKKNTKGGKVRYAKGLTECDIGVINFDRFRTMQKELSDAGFEMLVVDECFVSDTMVDTPEGPCEISKIKKNDPVLNCCGIDKVVNIFKRKTADDNICSVTVDGKKIVASRKHLFFTQRGWVEAQELIKGEDYVINADASMSFLQQIINEKTGSLLQVEKEKQEPGSATGVFSQMCLCARKKENNSKSSLNEVPRMRADANNQTGPATPETIKVSPQDGTLFLREILFSEMEDEPGRFQESTLLTTVEEESERVAEKVSQLGERICKETASANYGTLPYQGPRCKGKDIKGAQKDETQASYPRREWKTNTEAAEVVVQETRRNISNVSLAIGAGCLPGDKEGWIPNSLQNRHRERNSDVGDRGGRILPLSNGEKRTGCKERKEIVGTRVEDIKIFKPGDSYLDKYRDEKGRVVLYDLSMDRHPSFSVNGLLVHNSSKAKSPKSKTTKELIKYADTVPYVYLFSGTPAPNSELEYYSQIRMLDQRLLSKSFYSFRNGYFLQSGYGGFKWDINPEKREEFLEKLATVSSVIKKEDVLDLPGKTTNIRSVFLTPKEMNAYKEMEAHMIFELDGQESLSANSAVKCMKLREGTSGFFIDENGEIIKTGESKLKELDSLLEEIGDHQVIIWGNFHFEADQIQTRLLKAGKTFVRADGTVNQDRKNQAIKDFKSGKAQYFLGHPASVGHGITLTNANFMVYFSMSYSYELQAQSADRIYRKGQGNKCSYYYLVASGTIDEAIMKALDGKKKVTQSVFEYIKAKKKG